MKQKVSEGDSFLQINLQNGWEIEGKLKYEKNWKIVQGEEKFGREFKENELEVREKYFKEMYLVGKINSIDLFQEIEIYSEMSIRKKFLSWFVLKQLLQKYLGVIELFVKRW